MVLIKFPADWLNISGHVDVFLEATDEFFRSSSRIVSVAYYTTPRSFDGRIMSLGNQFMELQNARNRFDVKRDWRLFNRWRPPKEAANGMPPKWLRLINFPNGFE